MKTAMRVLMILGAMLIASAGWAAADQEPAPAGAAGQATIQIIPCPKTKMQRECLTCHVAGDFRVRETRADAHRNYPNDAMSVLDESDGPRGYFLLNGIDAKAAAEFFGYLRANKVTKAIIEIHSPGGSLFNAQRIISMIQRWQSEGNSLETRVDGYAASAGFLVFVAGDIGRRFVGPQADLMWHELMSFKMIDISTPSDKEEESRILRHLQNVRNDWLATRGKLTKAEIDDLIRKREFWMSGAQAVGFGFADGFIGGRR